MYKNTIVILF